ncbi:hypothetical protein F183_A45100 [Bryobacterales bacterium F-183]|nr:hypothetical protein F183_A45100 [Bryobacterales bacterium F-183]
MLLAPEFIDYIAAQLLKRMTPRIIETSDLGRAAESIATLIEDDLAIEDKLNDEARDLLEQYSEVMRKEGISYQDMFRKIKNQLIQQRKIIRASGRDTGDKMKLSRDKINDLSHKLVQLFKSRREFRVKGDANTARLEIVKILTEILQMEDKVDHAARLKVKTIKREITEGGEEWDVLHRRYYAEEMKKLGIDLAKI